MLPDIDGMQVLRGIREHSDEPAVVILTSVADTKSAIAAVREGADGYIEKQELAVGSDSTTFFFGVQQALEHRTGVQARRAKHARRFLLHGDA